MENGLLYILAFSAMAIALFACVLPQAQLYSEISGLPTWAEEVTWIIQTDGSNYWAVPANGSVYWTSSNLTYVAQNALDQGPGVDVFLDFVGEHYIDGLHMTLGDQKLRGRFQSSTTARGTTLRLRNGADEHLIHINGTANPDYYMIDSFKLQGNYSSISKNGIVCDGSPVHVEITNVQVYNCLYGYGLTGGSILWMRNCYAEGCSRGFSLNSWSYRNTMEDVCAYNCQTNFYVTTCSDINWYGVVSYTSSLYNGIGIVASSRMNFYGVHAELNKNHGIAVLGSHDINFYGADCFNNGQETNNTYSGIYFGDNGGTHSTYNAVYGGNIYSDTVKKQKYGVYEADSSDNYNLIDGVHATGAGTANILLQGANSIQDNVR